MFNLMSGMTNAGAIAAVLGLPEQWLMHDGSGDTFADATPNDNTITATDITWGTGTGVTSPTFNGSTSTAVAAQTDITNFDGTKPFSVSVWVNPSSFENSGNTLVSTINPSANYQGWEITIIGPSGQMLFLMYNNQSTNNFMELSTVGSLTAGTTANVIWTYDGSGSAAGVNYYLNGSLVDLNTIQNSLTASSASSLPLSVGARSGANNLYSGSMSNLQIFGTVLTSGQIAAIQEAGA